MAWCSMYREERLLSKVLDDVHSLPEFRVIGMSSNSEEFKEAFNCKTGQKNNPVKKCSIW